MPMISDYETFQLETFQLLEKAERYNAFIVSLFADQIAGRSVLEIGCGNGVMTRHLACFAKRIYGNDINENILGSFKDRFKNNPAIESFFGDIVSQAAFPYQVDCIVLINVLEHIQDDQKAIQTLRNYLAPEGRIIIFVPAFAALFSDLDRRFLHYRRYRRPSLVRLLNESGFSVEKIKYVNFSGFWGWWLNHKLLKKTQFNPRQVEFFDRYLVPLEKILAHWPLPFGQSLWCIVKAKDIST